MRCPRCAFKGELFHGRCAVCGFQLQTDTQESAGIARISQQPFSNTGEYSPLLNQYSPILDQLSISNQLAALQTLAAGNTLRRGRYRLLERVALPAAQQNQGMAWSAYDLQMSNRLVMLREIKIPTEIGATSVRRERAANILAQRLNKLGEHPGLPGNVSFSKGGVFCGTNLSWKYPLQNRTLSKGYITVYPTLLTYLKKRMHISLSYCILRGRAWLLLLSGKKEHCRSTKLRSMAGSSAIF